MDPSILRNQFNSIFKGYRWLPHVLYWLLIAIIALLQIKTGKLLKTYSAEYIVIAAVISLITVLLLSYSFLFFIIPLYSAPRRMVFWASMVLSLLFWYIIQIAVLKLSIMQYPAINSSKGMDIWALASRHSLSYLVMFCFFIAFYYFVDIYDRQREIQLLAKIKTEKIALESSFLKSQVNPHFLFNTLNNIYALSLKKSEQTPVIIDRLESLLHYMLYECKADLVPLADEFTFTNSYIALEKLRHRDDHCIVLINIEGDTSHQSIAPLLLINFLENAFKHGTKTSFGKSWINMNVTITDNTMHFNLQNSKPLQIVAGQHSEYNGGIGLKNVKRRLKILYPGKHKLLINDKKDRYEIDLTLNF